jgi:hypothetical protein
MDFGLFTTWNAVYVGEFIPLSFLYDAPLISR